MANAQATSETVLTAEQIKWNEIFKQICVSEKSKAADVVVGLLGKSQSQIVEVDVEAGKNPILLEASLQNIKEFKQHLVAQLNRQRGKSTSVKICAEMQVASQTQTQTYSVEAVIHCRGRGTGRGTGTFGRGTYGKFSCYVHVKDSGWFKWIENGKFELITKSRNATDQRSSFLVILTRNSSIDAASNSVCNTVTADQPVFHSETEAAEAAENEDKQETEAIEEIHIDPNSSVSINEFNYAALPELPCQFLWLRDEYISKENCEAFIATAEEKIKSDPLNGAAYHTIIAYLNTRSTLRVNYQEAEKHLEFAEKISAESKKKPSESRTEEIDQYEQYEGMRIDCGSSSSSDDSTAETKKKVDKNLDCQFVVDALRLWIRRERGCPLRELSKDWYPLHKLWSDAVEKQKQAEIKQGRQKTMATDHSETIQTNQLLVNTYIVEALSYRHFGRRLHEKAADTFAMAKRITEESNFSALFGEVKTVSIIRRDNSFIVKPNAYEINLWASAFRVLPADPVTRCNFLASCALALVNFSVDESNGKEAAKIHAEIRNEGKQNVHPPTEGQESESKESESKESESEEFQNPKSSNRHLSFRLAEKAFEMRKKNSKDSTTDKVDLEPAKTAFDLCQRVFRNLGFTDKAKEVKEFLKSYKNVYLEADEKFREAKERIREQRNDEANIALKDAKVILEKMPENRRNWDSDYLLIKILNLEQKVDSEEIERLYDEGAVRFGQRPSMKAKILARKGHFQICFARKPLEGWRTLYRAVELHADCVHKLYPVEINYMEQKCDELCKIQIAWLWQTFSMQTNESLWFWFIRHSPRKEEPTVNKNIRFNDITPGSVRNMVMKQSEDWKNFVSKQKRYAFDQCRNEIEKIYKDALILESPQISDEDKRFARFHLCESLLNRKAAVPDSENYFSQLVNGKASVAEKRLKAKWFLAQQYTSKISHDNLLQIISLGCKDIFLKVVEDLIKSQPNYPTSRRYEKEEPEPLDFQVYFSTTAYEFCARMLNCANSDSSGFYLQSLPFPVDDEGKSRRPRIIKSDTEFVKYLRERINKFLRINYSERSVDRGVTMRESRFKLAQRTLATARKSASSSGSSAQFEIDLLKSAKEHMDGLVELLPKEDGKPADANYYHACRNGILKLKPDNWTVLQTPSKLELIVKLLEENEKPGSNPGFSADSRPISHEEATKFAKTLFTKGKSLEQMAKLKLPDEILNFLAQREAFVWRKQGAWLFLWTHYGNMVHRRKQEEASFYKKEIKDKLEQRGGPGSLYELAQFAVEFAEETQWVFENFKNERNNDDV